MKMLLTVEIPHEPFNSLVRSGRAGEIIGRILDTIKPEAAYFTEQDGMREIMGKLKLTVNKEKTRESVSPNFSLQRET